ncbi:hypothetical protein acsn021_33790 [Anaerocolumna cellulosilytica]|uniref:Uncharacterized protein n=1 Tax=Anaerocolumna cellulosilytica TaxID=433286 RepID=A0A6S6R8N2_9FIRM|nr:alpha/beta hydrolase [Anaerocolumna cellulosilytica]MBB5196796.1 acetyl esterase/lipase [Anaerocolumna cellulosilytica]BCJ95810.1 hypothetical protein acsn021_33790 [Anaerocolumna cellulosilytica]
MRRSISSIAVEKIISHIPGKRMTSNKLTYKKSVQAIYKRGEEPYKLTYKSFSVDIKKETYHGVEYIILNPKKNSNKLYKSKIMYFHGGAFLHQPRILHWRFLNKIAKDTAVQIWVPVYPKIPFHNAKVAYKALMRLYVLFAKTVKEEKIIFMGDSSGGGLVLGMAQQIKNRNVKQPAELIMISPWLDVTMSSPYVQDIETRDSMLTSNGLRICGEYWAGHKSKKDPMVSPLYGDIRGLGRMTVFTGTHDILYVDSYRLYKKAKQQNIAIDYIKKKYMGHIYPLWPIPEAREAIKRIERIIEND